MSVEARQAVELAARNAYGRLVAWLASHCGDLELAEDAMGDALGAALTAWSEQGVPSRPEAWLLTAARRRVIDRVRREDTRERAADQLRAEAEFAVQTPDPDGLHDRRLGLLFVCAHPDVPADMHTPLMLQAVLGLTAVQIGTALLVKPGTIGQRLVRVKKLIRDRGLRFEVPPRDQWMGRLPAVHAAIYAAFGTGWADLGQGATTGLAAEALWLAQLLVQQQRSPDAESLGLLALLSFSHSRRAARRTADGAFVPLDEQSPADWDADLVLEGEKAVWMAGKLRVPGRYQLEAAIQSVHAHRAISGNTDWAAIAELYRVLVRQYPSLGAQIGLAAALGRTGAAAEALSVLQALPEAHTRRHQPYWAVRAWLQHQLHRVDDARASYDTAIGLTEDPAVREWLRSRRP